MRIFLIELSRGAILRVSPTVLLGPVDILVILLVSVVAGFVGALFGLGGGVLIIPFLTLVEGVPVPLAVGASIVSVVATSSASAATYVQDRLTNLRLGMFLAGALVALYLSASALFILFGLILLYATIIMIRARGIDFPANVKPDKLSRILVLGNQYEDHSLNRIVKYEVTRTPLTVFIGYAAGIVSGLLGVGGGIINVPTMNLVSKVPVKVASATSNFMIGVTAAASASVYLLRGDVHPLLAAPLIIGVAAGALLGTRVLKVTPPTRMKVAFGILLAAISLLMILKGLNLPVVL